MDIIFSEAHEDKWFKWSHFMTTACYLSIHKKHLTSEELDAELAKHFGEEKLKQVRSSAGGGADDVPGPSPAADVLEAKAEHDAAEKNSASNHDHRDEQSSRSGSQHS